MKIILALVLAALGFALAGCASAPASGGASTQALGGQISGSGSSSSQIADYRQTLSNPGPF